MDSSPENAQLFKRYMTGKKGFPNWKLEYFLEDPLLNPDGIQHVAAFAVEDSPYLMIGFEDLYMGGDLDFNDLLFAVDIGETNIEELKATASLAPEPGLGLMLVLFLGLTFCRHSKRRASLRFTEDSNSKDSSRSFGS